jgi:hypothetical protein
VVVNLPVRALAIATVVAAFALFPACDRRDDLDGVRRPPPGLERAATSFGLPTGGKPTVHDLLADRLGLLTYRDGFLLIDAGEPHLAAYRDAAGDWIGGATVDERRAALLSGRGAALWIPVHEGEAGPLRGAAGEVAIHLWARPAAPDQLVSVYLNERRLGDIRMPEARWGRYQLTAPAGMLRDGDNKLRLYFRHTGELAGQVTAAAIGRIAVGPPGQSPPEAPRLEAAPTTRGGDRLAAISVPEATRLAALVWVPADAPELALAVAGDGKRAAVRAARAGEAAETLWEGRAGPAWSPVRVDLAAFAGDLARLELVSESAASWGAPQLLAEPPEAPTGGGAAPAEHVVVWVVSGLRADRAFDPSVAPAMAAFAAKAVTASARSPSPSAGAGHAVIATGDMAAGERGSGPSAATLAERFKQAGHVTVVASGSPAVDSASDVARGAEVLFSPRAGARGAEAWAAAREVFEAHPGEPRFAYVALAEPDLPYQPSEPSVAAVWPEPPVSLGRGTSSLASAVRGGNVRLGDREQRFVVALHDASVRDADAAFASMLADLEALGIAERTAIILAGEYGQALFERGELGNRPSLYEEMVRVPIAARIPGQRARELADASLADVYATALAAAGIATPPGLRSNDLASVADPAIPRPHALSITGRSRGLAVGRYKLLVPSSGAHELYDLVHDPLEREDLAGAAPLAERYLRGLFGLALTYDTAWDVRRWGKLNSPSPAFADDVGG